MFKTNELEMKETVEKSAGSNEKERPFSVKSSVKDGSANELKIDHFNQSVSRESRHKKLWDEKMRIIMG